MSLPTIVIAVENSVRDKTPFFHFPLKPEVAVAVSENVGRKASVTVAEITDIEEAALKEESSIPPGCLPKGHEQVIDLSQRSLERFPVKVFAICKYLTCLFLQENLLESLPEELFTTFPLLRRLDVRQNKLTSIPGNIGDHPALEVLLLQDNQISTLPPHLGHCQTLRNLQLQGNPLIWPEENILSRGVKKILEYLRNKEKSENAVLKEGPQSDHETGNQQKESTDNLSRGDSRSQTKIIHTLSRSRLSKTGMNSKDEEVTKMRYTRGPRNTPTGKSNSKLSLIRRKSAASFDDDDQATLVCRRGQFPLGYHKRVSNVPPIKVYETLRRELWKDVLRQELLLQDYLLQKKRDSEALWGWRQKTRVMQFLPRQEKRASTVPFDQDESLQMMTWRELLQARNQSLEKNGHSKPGILARRAPDPSEGILKLLQDIDKLRADGKKISEQPDDISQSQYRTNLSTQINKLRELQKALRSIRII